MRCIWVTGQKGLSEHEAAVSIITEARQLVEEDLGMTGIKWKPFDVDDKGRHGKYLILSVKKKSPVFSISIFMNPKRFHGDK